MLLDTIGSLSDQLFFRLSLAGVIYAIVYPPGMVHCPFKLCPCYT